MTDVLDEVEWSGPALSLASLSHELEPGLPAVMHVRHSERPEIRSGADLGVALTERGKEAAYAFGARLTGDRVYRIYHSISDRARETAEGIAAGLGSLDVEALIVGAVPFKVNMDVERFSEYLFRDIQVHGGHDARPFFLSMVSGHYPPWEIEPWVLLPQRAAAYMVGNLKNAEPNGMDVYVSHDMWVAGFLFYWCGIMPDTDWVEFLDGFIVQLGEERMHVYTKDRRLDVYYPYWWKF
jgi:hypothetical protein